MIHFASIIRFYERTKATYTLSSHINVDGTKHVIDALRGMPPSSDKILVYCSSAGVLVPAFRPFRLRWKWSGYRNRFARSCVIDDDLSIPDSEIQTNHYTQTKWAADKLVRQANGADGLRTGVVSNSRGQLELIQRPSLTPCTAAARYGLTKSERPCSLFMYANALRTSCMRSSLSQQFYKPETRRTCLTL